MKKINKIKKIIGISILVLIVVICVYAMLNILPNKDKNITATEVQKIKYGYTQYNRDSKIYKEVFSNLKDELDKEKVDYNKYAEYISKLFIIDLYTLNNKTSKEDIGGMQYLKEELKENFILNASNTMYKYIGTENSDLPEVNSIELISIKETKYTIESNTYDAYEVNLKWNYVKNFGYENEGIIYLIKDNEQLYIVEKK